MYEAIVFLPLLGAVVAGIVCLVGARNRFPGEDPPPRDDHAAPPVSEDHARAAPAPHAEHAAFANTHVEAPEHVPSAAGSLLAALITSTFLGDIVGQVYALIVLTVAAAEAAIGLAILVAYFRNRGSIAVEDIDLLKG